MRTAGLELWFKACTCSHHHQILFRTSCKALYAAHMDKKRTFQCMAQGSSFGNDTAANDSTKHSRHSMTVPHSGSDTEGNIDTPQSLHTTMESAQQSSSNESRKPAAQPIIPVSARVPINEAAVLIPPPLSISHLRARLEHFIVPRDGQLLPQLIELLGCSEEFASKLCWFGAVYYCPVVPIPRASSSGAIPSVMMSGGEELARITQQREAGLKRWGLASDKSTPKRATDPHMTVHEGGYLRVHVYPKRFPAVYKIADWKARVLAVTPDYIAVDKPPGVQVPPTVDNIHESLLAQIERVLDLPSGSLGPPHRLDAGTSGIVILSRTPAFSRHFQTLLHNKTSRRSSAVPIPSRAGSKELDVSARDTVQMMNTHNTTTSGDTQPPAQCGVAAEAVNTKLESDESRQGTSATHTNNINLTQASKTSTPPSTSEQKCEGSDGVMQSDACEQQQQHVLVTDVVRKTYRCVTRLDQGPPSLGILRHWVTLNNRIPGLPEFTRIVPEGDPEGKVCELVVLKVDKISLTGDAAEQWGNEAYESELMLITGRTHQIRVQLAAIGRPLLGDMLYERLAEASHTIEPLAKKPKSGAQDNQAKPANNGDGAQARSDDSTSEFVNKLMSDWDPLAPIGLQAWRMEVPTDERFFKTGVFEAKDPWWRAA